MALKHLHELLEEDQEPFYIANKRFHDQKPPSKLCKNTCFFSFGESPELRKSPLCLSSPAPAKSPEIEKFVLNVPATTAALLLEAAIRIQKQQSSSKSKTQIKKVKFGGFGSILKKLKNRNSDKNGEKSFTCSCINSRVNTEISEEKLMDLENYGDFGSSPLSPFRFSLQRCPSSSGELLPGFTSPAASPVYHTKEDKENYETILGLASIEQLEEEDKEQCSPVSVLDPPFEEEDERENEDEDEDEDENLDCNYALVQRAQQQLFCKLRRFEKLAELDPIELEKILLEEEEEDRAEEEEYQVSNLIFEEKIEVKSLNYGEAVFGRECKKIDLSSQELRSNNIDMMVKSNLKNEFDDWNEFKDQREEIAIEFAFSIFGLLVHELGEELIHLAHS
uniref:DUF4378 domain-containing protein n=1 Tax=Solanum lycopersicum TaxID=4081 RepID=A0A3Q7JG62_SOLLC|nr:uncharacterized protein LOC104644378 [Solanum lycopersicum]